MSAPRVESSLVCYNCCRRDLSELDFWKASQRMGTCGKCRKTGPYEGRIFASLKGFKKALNEEIVRTVKRQEDAESTTFREDSDDCESSMGEVLTTVPFEFVALIDKEALEGDNEDSIFREIQECVEKADGYHYRLSSFVYLVYGQVSGTYTLIRLTLQRIEINPRNDKRTE